MKSKARRQSKNVVDKRVTPLQARMGIKTSDLQAAPKKHRAIGQSIAEYYKTTQTQWQHNRTRMPGMKKRYGGG